MGAQLNMMKNVRMSRQNHPTKRWYPADDVISDNAGAGTNVTPDTDSMAPKKHTPFASYEGKTAPPKGRALPIRGEGPTVNNGPTVGKNGIR